MKASNFYNRTIEHLPLLIALFCLWISLVVLYAAILIINSGIMVYTLDDAYIHLAISKNLNLYSVFGITRYEFSSSTSSPLWNLMVSAVFLLVGINDLVPLVLNVIFATVAVMVFYFLLKDFEMGSKYLTIVLISFVFFTSLPSLVFTGLEHMLHIVFSIPLVLLSARILSQDESSRRQSTVLLIVTFFSSAVRIETIFLVFPVVLLFSMKKKWTYVIAILGMTALPWLAYGIISVQNGWLLVSNSLLVKSVDAMNEGVRFFFVRGIGALFVSPHLLALLAASIKLTSSKELGFWHVNNVMKLIFVPACLLQVQLGRVGWFFRYEAYIVAIGIFVVSIQGYKFISKLDLPSLTIRKGIEKDRLYGLILLTLFMAPLVGRGFLAVYWTPDASNNIYEQQYQMGLFLDRFYTGETVLLNDIGCANYLADIRCVDKWGIGTLEIGEVLINGSMSTSVLQSIATQRGVKIAIVYADSLIPEDWEPVGEWTIRHNIVAHASTVTFYSILPSERDRLIDNLVLFSPDLPENVIQSGVYTILL
ncbi:MAG: hypothetical protein ACFFFK_11130 [Candidatus Thorarchaeota archaeon]